MGGRLTVTKRHEGGGEGVKKWPKLCYIINEWPLIYRIMISFSVVNEWLNRIQWVSEILSFKIRKHSKSRLCEGRISNGPDQSRTGKNGGFGQDHFISK